MYYYHYPYPYYYSTPIYPVYPRVYPRVYPPVDVELFEQSVKTFRLLMEQGSILLDQLGDADFAQKMMAAAQQGKKVEVDQLIQSIGLKVQVLTKYTPTGITFELMSQPDQSTPVNCCTLSVHMKWGN